MPTKSARGETARNIYAILHRKPDQTAEELQKHLPHLTIAAIRSALSKMEKRGAVAVRGVKSTRSNGCGRHAHVYHVKYKSGAVPAAKPKKVTPKAQPKPKRDMAAEYEAVYRQEFERHGDTLAELQKATAAHQRTVELLIEALDDLAETRQALEAAQTRRNWWDAVKGWFS
jgi:hypothetical protein